MDMRVPIRTVVQQTGLSAFTIRAWERRHQILDPDRTSTNRRLYSQAEIEKLILLKSAIEKGATISQIAALSVVELKKYGEQQPNHVLVAGDPVVAECVSAIARLDSRSLESILTSSATTLGAELFIFDVLVPVLRHLDSEWSKGAIRIRQEHLASATIRSVLDRVRTSLQTRPSAPKMLVTTPSGQLHELGALLVCILATVHGWNTLYFGPNLPVDEIVDAAHEAHVKAVALSIVYPIDDAELSNELSDLRERLSPHIAIVVGGRGVQNYERAIRKIKALEVRDLADLASSLRTIA